MNIKIGSEDLPYLIVGIPCLAVLAIPLCFCLVMFLLACIPLLVLAPLVLLCMAPFTIKDIPQPMKLLWIPVLSVVVPVAFMLAIPLLLSIVPILLCVCPLLLLAPLAIFAVTPLLVFLQTVVGVPVFLQHVFPAAGTLWKLASESDAVSQLLDLMKHFKNAWEQKPTAPGKEPPYATSSS
eukprot:Cvel_1951.t2-p1 / transcript=Cvel_1951.t2 / gene=Cvel_1951 / organism=Chromera_velia_CCMP2878 / gene_product=hypothetical protein / transcript_product=hypothetical protein / location=Cvel_scaffold74:15132-17975(+) / protein_length=180 / sequence_SO=supercontig / SO=protein_coding / is_pseudo=false